MLGLKWRCTLFKCYICLAITTAATLPVSYLIDTLITRQHLFSLLEAQMPTATR